MFRKIVSRGHRVYRVWIVSYAVILALPLIAWILMQSYSYSIIGSLTHLLYGDMLSIAAQTVDAEMDKIDDLGMEIATSPSVDLYASGSLPSASRNAWRNYQISLALRQYCLRVSKSVQRIYIYGHTANRVVADDCAFDADLYYSIKYAELGETLEEWKAQLGAERAFGVTRTLKWRDGRESVCFVYALPIAALVSSDTVAATLVLEMKPDAIKSLLESLNLGPDMGLTVSDGAGNVILRVDAALQGKERATELNLTAQNGWQYALVVPEHVYLAETSRVRAIMPIALAATVLFGALLAAYFLRKNYDPLKAVLETVGSRTGLRAEGGVNEYAYLSHSFDSILENYSTVRRRMEEQLDQIRSARLIQLFVGNALSPEDARDSLNLLEFDAATETFAVLIARSKSDERTDIAAAAKALRVGGAPDSLLGGKGVLMRGDALFLLDCMDFSSAEYQEMCAMICARSEANGYFLAFSDMYVGARGIPEAYQEARWRLYSVVAQGTAAGGNIVYGAYVEALLSEAVRAGDEDAAREALGKIWRLNESCAHHLPSARRLAAALLGTLERLSRANGQTASNEATRTAWDLYAQCADCDSLMMLTLDIARGLCIATGESASSAENRAASDLRQRILDYVREHYADQDLSVESVCDHFERAPSTVSRLFKEEGEGGLLNHINECRIRRARELILTRRDARVSDIYSLVGYNNPNTFIRQFKRFEGVTPGRFREIAEYAREHGAQDAATQDIAQNQ